MPSQADPAALSGGPGFRVQSPLKPAITRRMLLFFIIGDILGGGIYALVGEVAGEIGGAVWLAFLLAGVVAAFTAASYAELVSKYPYAAIGHDAMRRVLAAIDRAAPRSGVRARVISAFFSQPSRPLPYRRVSGSSASG